MRNVFRRLVLGFDIFVNTIFGFLAFFGSKLNLDRFIICFHCTSSSVDGYESVSSVKLLKLYQKFREAGFVDSTLGEACQDRSRSPSFCFTFDDGCGGWEKFSQGKFSFCISTDSSTWCCDFDPNKIVHTQIYDHLNRHDSVIYKAKLPITSYSTGLSKHESIIVLPFGGGNYFLNFGFLSRIKDVTLVTTMNESLLRGFVTSKNMQGVLMENNIKLVARTSYYKGDNFFSLIGRSSGGSDFLQKYMQGNV